MPKKKDRVTITDVAKTADVAIGTVSRVLNNATDVSADIRARVWQAARTLNYSRLRQRRQLTDTPGTPTTTTGNIGALFFGMEDTLVHLPIVSSGLQGIESALSAKGRSLMLANIPRGDRIPPFLREQHVEGLILKGPNQGALPALESNELLQHINQLPHIWLMGRLPNAKGDHINFDTMAAGRMAAEHLFEKGHRLLAFLNPKPGQIQFERVKLGFTTAASSLGCTPTLLEVPPPSKLTWPLPAITAENQVELLVERWLALPTKQRPTAIFVPSDRTAVQLYSALEHKGLRAGSDVSIISCNNEKQLILSLRPALTTIDVHAEQIGRRAVDQLLWRIAHPDSPCEQILIEPALILGDSVASR